MKIDGIKYNGKNNEYVDGANKVSIASEIKIREGAVEIGNAAFAGNKTIRKVTLSDSLITLRDSTFANCTNLKEINLKNIEYIGSFAFQNTAIEKLIIPSSVKNISSGGLSGMKNLKTLIFKCDMNVFDWNPFDSKFLYKASNLETIYAEKIDKNSEFYMQYKDYIKPLTLDVLIEENKSFKEINKLMKEIKTGLER